MDRLRVFKQTIQQVSRNFEWNPLQFDDALSLEDRLGLTLRVIWAVEHDSIGAFDDCLHRYPILPHSARTPTAFLTAPSTC